MPETRTAELIRFGRRIQHARNQRGWSLRELAAKADCSFSSISRVENATGDVWLSIALRILRALNLTFDGVLADCPHCGGRPPAGFTCNECGAS